MASIENRHVWLRFFKLWRESISVWKINSEQYKDRKKKKMAYCKLLEVYLEIDPNASMMHLKNKIANIRTCFRREHKKVEQTKNSDDPYVPNLWYYSQVYFLSEHDGPEEKVNNQDDEDDDDDNDDDDDTSDFLNKRQRSRKRQRSMDSCLDEELITTPGDNQSYLEETQRKRQPPKEIRKVRTCLQQKNIILRQALNYLKQSDKERDDADIYAKAWAATFRKLDGTQKILAKKAIDEILVLGQFKKLAFNSLQIMPNVRIIPSSRPTSPEYVVTEASNGITNLERSPVCDMSPDANSYEAESSEYGISQDSDSDIDSILESVNQLRHSKAKIRKSTAKRHC